MTLETLRDRADALRAEIGKTVLGQEETIDLLLVALFAGGHVLLEGPPGTAKTLLARSFSAALDLDFGRVQFTPDLMPGDILGTSIFNFQTNTFIPCGMALSGLTVSPLSSVTSNPGAP
jgi:MoxR-like ATPase